MKKLLCILCLISLTLTLVSCAQVVNSETEVVEATIVEVDKDPARVVNKVVYAADYDILLNYQGIETWIDIDRTQYQKYKELVGTSVEVNLITKYYDNNTVKQQLQFIEE